MADNVPRHQFPGTRAIETCRRCGWARRWTEIKNYNGEVVRRMVKWRNLLLTGRDSFWNERDLSPLCNDSPIHSD